MQRISIQARKVITDAITATEITDISADNVIQGYRPQGIDPATLSVSIFINDSNRVNVQTGNAAIIHEVDYAIYGDKVSTVTAKMSQLITALEGYNDDHTLMQCTLTSTQVEVEIDGVTGIINSRWFEMSGVESELPI